VSPDGEEGGEEWVDEMGEGRQRGRKGKRRRETLQYTMLLLETSH